MVEGTGDELVANGVLLAHVGVTLAAVGGVWWRAPGEETVDDAAKGLSWTEPGVGCAAVPGDFALDAVFWVGKHEVPRGDEGCSACIMQRGGNSGTDVTSEGNLSMAEQEGHGVCVQ
jgi:hypothetical protein